MDYHSIKELIRKFWLGETSLEEENILKEYFRYNQNAPEEFEETARYFNYIEEENKPVLGDDFDNLIMDKIKGLEGKKTFRIWPMLIAACITLMLGLTVFNVMNSDQSKDNPTLVAEEEFIDTYSDPEEAYANVKMALMKVSSGLKEGVSYTGEMKKFSEAQKEISKSKKK